MSQLSDIEPKFKPNVMDLVKAAGINVSDWGNGKGGEERAASNPKHCYEWAFVEPSKVIVLNLWHHYMEEKNGGIIMRNMNLREDAKNIDEASRAHRAERFDGALQTALKEKLKVRVIVQVGKPPGTNNKVDKRSLDPVEWTITNYDWETGSCTLIRGVHESSSSKIETENAVDDLANVPEGNNLPDRASAIVKIIKRDNRVRAYVVKRAKGKCEYCGARGFETANGGFYVETHHIIALCDSGRDTVDNVIALCPQHHRQAHYGIDAESLEAKFIARLKELN